jgi:TolA-binding protein
MRQFFVIIVVLTVIGGQAAVADLTPVTDELFSYETKPEKIEIPDSVDPLLRTRLESIYRVYEKGEVLQGLDLLIDSEVEHPELREIPAFTILEAELYYLLGISDFKVQFEVAKPRFRNIFYKNPGIANEPLLAFRLATMMKRMKLFPEAEGFYRLLMEKHPKSKYAKEARLGLAYSHLEQDHFGEALYLLGQVQKDDEYQSYWPYALAMEATIRYRERKRRKALQLFREAFAKGLKPEELTAEELFYYAETLFANKLEKKGYEHHCNLIERPDAGAYLSGALLRIADYEISVGKRDKAVERYKELYQKYPESEPGYLAAIRLGDLRAESFPRDVDEQVIRSYKAVAESLAPNAILNVAKQRLSSYYYSGGAFKESVRYSSDLLRSNPTVQIEQLAKKILREAFAGYLEQVFAQRNYAEACEFFRLHRNEIMSTALSRELVERIFRIHEQMLQYDTIVSIADEKNIKARYMSLGRFYAGKALMAKGEEKKGAKLLILVANRGDMPEGSLAMVELAALQERKGDTNGAMGTLRRVLSMKELPPAIFAETSIRMADLQMLLGEYQAGEKLYDDAARILNPGSGIGDAELFADALFGLADVRYRLGRYKESHDLYRAAVGGFPEDVRIPLAKMRLEKLEADSKNNSGTIPDIKDRYWADMVRRMKDQMNWSQGTKALKG